jgi:hypothetical protein
MILPDKIEIITADVEGIANFSANNESLETDKQSPVVSSTYATPDNTGKYDFNIDIHFKNLKYFH